MHGWSSKSIAHGNFLGRIGINQGKKKNIVIERSPPSNNYKNIR
jgi:hypothetical protein